MREHAKNIGTTVTMLLQLEVIVSSNIQRKKPWPRIEWVGSQKESVFLLDQRRASKLYLPSGRTQRILSSLKQYSGRIICVNTSLSGNYTFCFYILLEIFFDKSIKSPRSIWLIYKAIVISRQSVPSRLTHVVLHILQQRWFLLWFPKNTFEPKWTPW